MSPSNLDLCYPAFVLVLATWVIFASPPRHLSQREYGEWYRTRYLNGLYWQAFRRFRRWIGGGRCAHRRKGGCQGALQVHHRKFAYKYLYYEWLVLWGTVVLCDAHHKRIHKLK